MMFAKYHSAFTRILPLPALLLLTISAFAQSSVGIINVQRAMLETSEIKKASAELEARFKPRNDELAALQNEIQQLNQQIQSGGTDVPPAQLQTLQGELQLKQRRAQRLSEDLQQDVNIERDKILRQVGQRMQAIVQNIAETKNLDVVVDVSNTVYFKPALDVTQEAISAYDAAHPVSAPAAAPPAANQ
jgi:outer membrane protein